LLQVVGQQAVSAPCLSRGGAARSRTDGAAHRALVPDIDKPVPFAPDLAAEVASPSQDAGMAAKGIFSLPACEFALFEVDGET
jgi:hypothetical protein